MSTVDQLRARAQQLQNSSAPAAPINTGVEGATALAVVEETPKVSVQAYRHPVAGSTTVTPNGKVLVFAGEMSGQGDKRHVGEGFYETSDEAEIAWLDGVAAMRSNMVTKVVLNATDGSVAAVKTPKFADPALMQAPADAAKNAQDASTLQTADKNFAQAIKTGAAVDTANGGSLPVDTSMQQALQNANVDLSKQGTVHNPGDQ